MVRLLCILSSMNAGGAETFLMKIYRNLDRNKFQLDFCINEKEKCFYEDEINSLGGKIFRIPSKSENYKAFKTQLFKLVNNNGYQHVLRITSNTMGFMDLKIAKKAGARVCCARSSNSSDGGGFKEKVAHFTGRLLYDKYVDVAIAPSDLAAAYTFGNNYKNRTLILHNAVDLDVFKYSKEARLKIRNEFSIPENTKVFGHVGRFMEQKNHVFLADIFRSIKNTCPDAVFLLVGDGPLKEKFINKVRELEFIDSVVFAGIRSDIPDLLSAMDAFVFPSFYEGMPNTVIEAQATGLPCVISDSITKEANITGLVEYLPLALSAEEWAEKSISKAMAERIDTKESFVNNNYDIESVTRAFEKAVFI